MKSEIEKLNSVWVKSQQTSLQNTLLPELKFEDIISSLISTGPFYYYIVDFFDRSLSNVSDSIRDIHGLDPETVTFSDILDTIHPEDMDFVSTAESSIINFMYNVLGKEMVLNYKTCYSYRSRMKNGEYAMLNHQALVLTIDEQGRFGKSLNIHTCIDHLTKTNSYQASLIGLNGMPSYMNLNLDSGSDTSVKYTQREIDILKLLSDGMRSDEIANHLFISPLTVKKHRNNILAKTDCKNTSQLIKKSILQGLI